MYIVTAVDISGAGATRLCGWFPDLTMAIQQVSDNKGCIRCGPDRDYDLVLIQALQPGMLRIPDQVQWFRWVPNWEYFTVIDQPEEIVTPSFESVLFGDLLNINGECFVINSKLPAALDDAPRQAVG